ncbi:MAG: hypothetical protein LBU73_02690 [Helicobacteraceae bacterium]|jgi:hypothetical protein|nr:hypothetical protein [Helicobacteraceae bacterium]
MFSDEKFTALKKRFAEVKKHYLSMIDEKRNVAAKTVISKGCMYNVLPFENEQHGYKVNGKIIPAPIMRDDCYIYRLDENGRVILMENMSEFLKIPTYFSLYTYFEDYIEHIYGDNSAPYRAEWAYRESGTVKKILCCAAKSCSVNLLEYEDSVLMGIRFFTDSGQPFNLQFLYDANGALQAIFRIWPKGQKATIYSTAKINYKALGLRLFAETEQAVSAFLKEHDGEHFTRFALDCYTGHGYVSLCFDTDLSEQYKDSPADWAHCDFASLPLVEFPLDDEQIAKVKKTAIKVAGDLLKSEAFRTLAQDGAFRILVFDHNELLCEKP